MDSPTLRTAAALLAWIPLAAWPHAGLAQGAQRQLALVDVSTTLAQLIGNSPLDYVARGKIAYTVTGAARFDAYFRNTAIAFGGFYFGRHLIDDATTELKKYARSKMAVAELRAEIRALTQDADTSGWTLDQSLAVLNAASKRDQVTQEERLYFGAMSLLVAATVPVVRAALEAAPLLAREAPTLVRSAPDAVGILQVPRVLAGLDRSARQMAQIPREGVGLLESYAVLSRGLRMLNGDG